MPLAKRLLRCTFFTCTAVESLTLPEKTGRSNFIEFQRLSDRTMASIITAGSIDGKNYMDCNSPCTSHPGRLQRAAHSFAFSLSQTINYSLLTLESKLKQLAMHQNTSSKQQQMVTLLFRNIISTGSLLRNIYTGFSVKVK